MTDNTGTCGEPDRSLINVNQDHELRYRTQTWMSPRTSCAPLLRRWARPPTRSASTYSAAAEGPWPPAVASLARRTGLTEPRRSPAPARPSCAPNP